MNLTKNPKYETLEYLWPRVVKSGKDKCEICGSRDVLECHHIVTRGDLWNRWEKKNGLLACRKCHERPDKIMDWLEQNNPARYRWAIRQRAKVHRGRKIDFEAIERKLRLQI